jgi:putative membrane protein
MNRPLLIWMICLALAAGVTALAATPSAAESLQGTAPQVAAGQVVPAPACPIVQTPPTAAPGRDDGLFSRVRPADLVAVVVYALLGLFLGLFGYKVYDWLTPFDLRKELEIDQNTSVGIVCGAIILGMCLIVAAAIRG